jgi:elongation factor P
MITAGDFRTGKTIEYDGQVYRVIEFQHVKPGKGAAFVRTKLKDIRNGGVIETSFRPTEKFEEAQIDRIDMQYLYKDGDTYNFMNAETFDQVALTEDDIADVMKFVKENEFVKVLSYK